MDARSFSSGQEPCRKARPDPRAWSAAGAEGRRTQGAVLFGYFLLGKQEKVTRRPKDVETAFESATKAHAHPRTASPMRSEVTGSQLDQPLAVEKLLAGM